MRKMEVVKAEVIKVDVVKVEVVKVEVVKVEVVKVEVVKVEVVKVEVVKAELNPKKNRNTRAAPAASEWPKNPDKSIPVPSGKSKEPTGRN